MYGAIRDSISDPSPRGTAKGSPPRGGREVLFVVLVLGKYE